MHQPNDKAWCGYSHRQTFHARIRGDSLPSWSSVLQMAGIDASRVTSQRAYETNTGVQSCLTASLRSSSAEIDQRSTRFSTQRMVVCCYLCPSAIEVMNALHNNRTGGTCLWSIKFLSEGLYGFVCPFSLRCLVAVELYPSVSLDLLNDCVTPMI